MNNIVRICSLVAGPFLSGMSYAIDSSSLGPVIGHPFIQTFVLASGAIPQISIPDTTLAQLYVYFDTKQQMCPGTTKPYVVANLSSITTTGVLQSFILISPFGLVPTPTWQTTTSIAYGGQGEKQYGAGYYQTFAMELDITPQDTKPAYPAYPALADLSYTFYCMAS